MKTYDLQNKTKLTLEQCTSSKTFTKGQQLHHMNDKIHKWIQVLARHIQYPNIINR
jgi:hypothetical protein